ncbi:hypothetical protein BC830DRAFT_903358 [Chytriomyces sp. MP71]|nr:hypothetical protein BC830DRAFT_903358 [Chytriomyces sp. MP71]
MAELLANYGGYSTSSIVRQQDPPMERPILERELQSLIAKRHQLLYCKWKWSYICSLLDSTRISIYPNELINIEWHLNASWTEEPGRSCFHRVVGKAGTQNLVAHSTLWDGHHLQVRYVDARGERIRLGDYPSRMTWGWHMRNRWVLNTSLGKPGVPLQLREAICAIAFGL